MKKLNIWENNWNQKIKLSSVINHVKKITKVAILSSILLSTGCHKWEKDKIIPSKTQIYFDVEKNSNGKEYITKWGIQLEKLKWTFDTIDIIDTFGFMRTWNAIWIKTNGQKCIILWGEEIRGCYDDIEAIENGFIISQRYPKGKFKQSYTKKWETPKYWYDSMEHLVDDFFIVKEVYEEGGRGEGVSKNGEKPKVWFSFIDRKRVFSIEKKNPSDFELAVLWKGWGMSVNGEEPKKWYDDICEFYKVYGLGSYGERTSECWLKE